jgi:enoyl-[acyl-carrier-protein] reductase (NADH)
VKHRTYREMLRQYAEATGVSFEEVKARLWGERLVGRLPTLTEVANVATLMASDRPSAITGAFVSVTCGSRFD